MHTCMHARTHAHTHTHTHTNTKPFYCSLDIVWVNPGELITEETFTHSYLTWSSVICHVSCNRWW